MLLYRSVMKLHLETTQFWFLSLRKDLVKLKKENSAINIEKVYFLGD